MIRVGIQATQERIQRADGGDGRGGPTTEAGQIRRLTDAPDPGGNRGFAHPRLEREGPEQGDGVAAGTPALPGRTAQGGPQGLEIGPPTPGDEISPHGRIERRQGCTIGGMTPLRCKHEVASFSQESGSKYQSSEHGEAIAFVKGVRGIARNRGPSGGGFQQLVKDSAAVVPRPFKPGAGYEFPKRLIDAGIGLFAK